MNPLIGVAGLAIAFWPVWQWYVQRVTDGSDEPLNLLALATLLALTWMRRSRTEPQFESSQGNPSQAKSLLADSSPASSLQADSTQTDVSQNGSSKLIVARKGIALSACFVIAYCATWLWAPKLVQALFALAAIATLLTSVKRFPKWETGDWLLLFLAVPLVASMNFFAGFPLRLVATRLAAILINLSSFPVTASGTEIVWNNQVVSVDPPCSGIKMLWLSIYLAAALMSWYRLTPVRSIQLLVVGVATSLLANALRVSSLFMLETGIFPVQPEMHDTMHSAIGLVAFALGVVAVIGYGIYLGNMNATASTAPPTVPTQKPQPQAIANPAYLLVLCGIAAALPCFAAKHEPQESTMNFPGWPERMITLEMKPVKLPAVEEKFLSDFPGKVEVFTDGRATYIFRFVQHATRQLHSSADCYQGAGYAIKWLGVTKQQGVDWEAFLATKGDERVHVQERIFDNAGNNFSDVSAWYWSAMTQRSVPPYWGVTVAQRVPN